MSEQNKQESKGDYGKTLYFSIENYYTYMYYVPKIII